MPDKFSCCGPGTGTNYEKRVNGTRNSVGNSNRENGPTFLDFPVFLGIFQWDEPTKRDSMYPVEDCVNLAQNVKM